MSKKNFFIPQSYHVMPLHEEVRMLDEGVLGRLREFLRQTPSKGRKELAEKTGYLSYLAYCATTNINWAMGKILNLLPKSFTFTLNSYAQEVLNYEIRNIVIGSVACYVSSLKELKALDEKYEIGFFYPYENAPHRYRRVNNHCLTIHCKAFKALSSNLTTLMDYLLPMTLTRLKNTTDELDIISLQESCWGFFDGTLPTYYRSMIDGLVVEKLTATGRLHITI